MSTHGPQPAPNPERPTTPPLTARATLRWAVVEPMLRRLTPRTVLELGCGQGAVGARIAAHCSYIGVEPDESSYSVAAERIRPLGGRVLLGDHTVVPHGSAYDVVCAFEVLEHLADDAGLLGAWVGLVRPGGHVVVSVPEGPERFGASDTMVGHYRRYTSAGLRTLLEGCGLVDVRVRHYGWPLGYLLEAVSNRISQRRLDAGAEAGEGHGPAEVRSAGSGRYLQPGAVAGAALRVGALPFAMVQRMVPGRGTGLVAVARRPG